MNDNLFNADDSDDEKSSVKGNGESAKTPVKKPTKPTSRKVAYHAKYGADAKYDEKSEDAKTAWQEVLSQYNTDYNAWKIENPEAAKAEEDRLKKRKTKETGRGKKAKTDSDAPESTGSHSMHLKTLLENVAEVFQRHAEMLS